MGDRANILIKSGDEQVCLYTHYMGYDLPSILQRALDRGFERVDDFQYITRIIFNEMTKGREIELTGFGITSKVHDNERDIITFDVDDQSIKIGEATFSVDEYAYSRLYIDEWSLIANKDK